MINSRTQFGHCLFGTLALEAGLDSNLGRFLSADGLPFLVNSSNLVKSQLGEIHARVPLQVADKVSLMVATCGNQLDNVSPPLSNTAQPGHVWAGPVPRKNPTCTPHC